ncbi:MULTISPECIES: glycoside hydrolase family 108 protein [Lysobacter]|uniref:glycoside hydrolase family 108 protein n=1 Tax=Lysobacter TaxID=68 RepID=UPI001F42541B|nr:MULTISPECIES: glycosyl hydrolase 108 family protein [Lysobacter]UJB21594.1 N-acetylmuramidase [Lysobacter capsici]UJQ29289.1 N-acetylmuramidase [Lysobacter gummosus]
MAEFNDYFPQLLIFEGGYVDDPYDPGGATNMGITLQTFQAHAQTLLGVAPTLANLQALSPEQAAVLYKALYWDAIYGDSIAAQDLAAIVFDFYVNAGVHAILLLQNLLGPPLAADGHFGPETLAAVQHADQASLYALYRQGRINYYNNLAASHPLLRRFLSGWLARANWFPAQLPAGT